MKRILSVIMIVCLLASFSGNAMADSVRTSKYAQAASFADMQFLFENNEEISGGNATVGMIVTALGRYMQIEPEIGSGTGNIMLANTTMHSEPDNSSPVLRTLSQNMDVIATGISGQWAKVTVEGSSGYVPLNSVSLFCAEYSNIPYGMWFTPYMLWAVKNEIVTEDSVNSPVTREKLATILTSFVEKMGYKLTEINPIYYFSDSDHFSNGTDAATKLQTAGIILEKEDGSYGPGEYVSISEAQGILLRLLPNVERVFDSRLIPVGTVNKSDSVDDSWFDDACFIGHSQVVGMKNYFNLPNADYYAVVGHTAQNVVDHIYYDLPKGGSGTLEKALNQAQYGKVYIMLGINDCNDRDDRLERFTTPMRKILDMVKETQPDAQIYLLSLAPIGRYTPNDLWYTMDNVILFTQTVKSFAREYNAEYLDVFRLMCDESGYITDEFNAGDGIHINALRYEQIKDFLKCHTA